MSDETTQAIIERITVPYPQPQEILGGHKVTTFFDTMRLTPAELARLAAQAVGDLSAGSFNMAVGIAYTGVYFASAVAGGKEVGILTTEGEIYGPSVKDRKILLVDDVIVNGKRILEASTKIKDLGGQIVGYACIVDRSQGRFKDGIIYSAYQSK